MAPLSLFPRNRIKRLDHLAVGGMLALFFVFAVLVVAKIAAAVVDIMLHGNRVSGSSGLLKDFLNFTCFRVIFQWFLEGLYGPV